MRPGSAWLPSATCSGDRTEQAVKRLSEQYGARAAVKPEHVFTGFDALPEGARRARRELRDPRDAAGLPADALEAAIRAGKHIFTEKPVAVDGPGIRKVLALAKEAEAKSLSIVAGTQRRHQHGYIETMKRVHDGAIGDIVRHAVRTGTRASCGSAIASRVERHGVAAAQLAVLHLALRRPHRRAAHPQHRRDQLGHAGPPGQRHRHGRAAGAHRHGVRPHLRPLRDRLRVSRRLAHDEHVPPDRQLRQQRLRGASSAPRAPRSWTSTRSRAPRRGRARRIRSARTCRSTST